MAKKSQQDEFLERLESIEARLTRLEGSQPHLRVLSWQDMRQAIENDPYVRFEVLKDWQRSGYRFRAGQIVHADRTPMLRDYVQSGLQCGVPSNHPELLEQLNQEAEARRQLAQVELQAIQDAADIARIAAQSLGLRALEADPEDLPEEPNPPVSAVE